MKQLIFIPLLLLLLSGCTGKQAPMTTYMLTAPSPGITSAKYRNKTLRLAYTTSVTDQAGYKMYYSYADTDQGTYQNSQWVSAVGSMLQGVLMDTIQQSHMFKAVLPYSSSLSENYRLESSIFDLSHHVRGKSSFAVVSIQFTLISVDTGNLIKSRRFSYREPTMTTDAKGYAEAINRIMEKLGRDLVRWL